MTARAPESGVVAWQEDDLAQELTTLLRHCTNLFAHFNYDTGWPSEAMQREYVASMRDAFKKLRFELHGVAVVQDEHQWCL